MAKSKGVKNLQSNDGLILTIDSDSDEDVDVRTNLKKKTEEDDENEISPDFKFVADGDDVIQDFNGWDFKVENKHDNRSVDLDGILKRKGGLSGLVNADDEVGDEVDSDEGSEEGSMKSKQSNEDDELALDGFGMGFKNEEESGQNLDENDDSQEQGPSQENNKTSETDAAVVSEDDYHEDEKDSEQAISQFYSSDGIKGLYTNFQSLQLSRPLLKGLAYLGYVKPSPIQSSAIPIALLGKDIVAGAVTGSGKTAAYMIPIIERLIYKPAKVSSTRVIVLTPTRELAIQVSDVGKKIGRFVNNLSFGLAVGGLNLRQQEQQLKSRPDIVFATPGRLIDHIRNSPSFSIESLEILVIDEADRMLEEGFQAELTEILTLIPKHKRQTLLFSATMNTKIKDLIQLSLDRPVRIIIDPPKATSSKLIEEFVRIRKRDHLKAALLFELLKQVDPSQRSRIVVFVSRKETAHNLRIILGFLGLRVSELHGSLSQEQRLKSVSDFKSLEVPVLICTDLAARGLDIPKIEIVINYDMPKTHEIYLHRVGRTARAGREGKAITFVGESSQDRAIVKETLKSLESKKKAVSRNVDWSKVEVSNSVISSKGELIKEVLEEEKQEKEIIQAEMQLHKASNLLEHEKEIHSRPKRTWFEDKSKSNKSEIMQKLTNRGKKVNSKKRKTIEAVKEGPKRVYKKTRKDRMDTKRPPSIKKKKRN